MKKLIKNKLVLLSVLSLFLFSCGNDSDKKQASPIDTPVAEEHHHDEKNKSIELNNGEKWKVDNEMMTHLRNMENDVSIFEKSEKKNYKELAEKLKTNIDLLTSNCTMTGKAHDELHKWLLPFIDLVNEFSNSNGDSSAAELFARIKTSFVEFNKYFQ